MEQTWNKGMMPDFSWETHGRENSREFERGGKNGSSLTENIQTKSDAKLKKTFTSSFQTANAGFIAWCVLVVSSFICLGLWNMTGIRWIALIGAGLFLLATAGILLAFAAQTAN
jgi:hypothetical protein